MKCKTCGSTERVTLGYCPEHWARLPEWLKRSLEGSQRGKDLTGHVRS